MTDKPSIESLTAALLSLGSEKAAASSRYFDLYNLLKASIFELAALRESDAALRAENEGLKAERDDWRCSYDGARIDMDGYRTKWQAAEARAAEAEKAQKMTATILAEYQIDCDAERARADALADKWEIALAYAGPAEDPNIGWRGTHPSTNDHFQCERCGAEHLNSLRIEHKPGCKAAAFIEALSSTPAADLEAHDARVRREVLEGAWERMGHAPDPHDPGFFVCNHITVDRWYALRAAILGTAPQPSTENTAPREEETK